MEKEGIRSLLRERGIAAHDRKESQDLCFQRQLRGEPPRRYRVKDRSGEDLGEVAVSPGPTVGQRRGLGLGGSGPHYVLRVDAGHGIVTVGPKEALLRSQCSISGVRWVSGAPPAQADCDVKIRYRHPGALASVVLSAGGRATVRFDEPQSAPTPGQVAAFYQGEVLLGGGFIDEFTPR
jgi:tRNA-specific 2-thiouridylase